MKTDNKEEAIKLKLLQRGFEKDKIINNRGLIGEVIEDCTSDRFDPETFDRVEKPEYYDDYINGDRGTLLLVTNTPRQELIKAYNNALTLPQLLERYKDMSGLKDVKKIKGCEDPRPCLRGCHVYDGTCKHPVY